MCVSALDPIRAVDGVSLQIESGEFLTLLGPSGCGKSTTLKLIGGFEPPDSGDVLLAGDVAGPHPAAQAAGEHRLPELRALSPHDG